MTQPTPYNKSRTFADSSTGVVYPVPASFLDTEFTLVEQTVDEICTNLALIQRDDGLLANQSVHPDSLSEAVTAMMGNWNPRGDWATGRKYAKYDMAHQGGLNYVAVQEHTSGTFDDDLIAGYWQALGISFTVNDLAGLKGLTSRPPSVIVKTGSAAGTWEWEAGDSTTPDDALVVQCTSGAAGRYKRIFDGNIHAAWFDDGQTADVVLSAAATAAKARNINVLVGAGTWTLAADARIINPGVEFIGEGPGKTIIRKVGQNSCFKAAGTTPAVAGGSLLASDATQGSLSITLASATGWTVGQRCILLSEAVYFSGLPTRKAEFVVIQKIVGNTITMWSPLKDTYTTANTARLVPVSFLEGVGFRNLTIEMDAAATVSSSASFQELFGIDLRWCWQPIIENVKIKNSLSAGVFLTGCSGAKIEQYSAEYFGSNTTGSSDPSSSEGTPGFGYGIREDALNEGLIVESMLTDRVRESYTCTGGYDAVWQYGGQFGTLITNSLAFDARSGGFDTHIMSFGIRFNNCHVIGSRFLGFQLRSRSASTSGCSAVDTLGPAMWIRGGSDGGAQVGGDYVTVTGFIAERNCTGVDGVIGLDWREYGAIVCSSWESHLSDITVRESSGPLITIGDNGVGRRTVLKNIVGYRPCLLASTKKYAIDVMSTQTDGLLTIDGLLVHDVAGNVVDLVRRSEVFSAVHINNARGYGYTGVVASSVTWMDGISIVNSDNMIFADGNGPQMREDFLGRTLSGLWGSKIGSNGSVVAPAIFTGLEGIARMTTGADAGGTMALNGVQMDGSLNWRANAGGFVSEIKLKTNAITDLCLFVGFTDQFSILEMPFTLSGTTLTSNATDAFGVLFDTAATNKNWHIVGVANDVDAAMQNLGIAPVANTYDNWRFTLSSTGRLTVRRNGLLIGSDMSGAVTSSVLLCPVVAAFSRGAASRNVDISRIYARQSDVA